MTDSVRTVCCMGASPEHFRSLFVLPARKSNFNQAAESWRIKQNSSSRTQTPLHFPIRFDWPVHRWTLLPKAERQKPVIHILK